MVKASRRRMVDKGQVTEDILAQNPQYLETDTAIPQGVGTGTASEAPHLTGTSIECHVLHVTPFTQTFCTF